MQWWIFRHGGRRINVGWVDVVEVMEVVGCRCVVGVGATCWAWWVGGLVVFGGLWWAVVGEKTRERETFDFLAGGAGVGGNFFSSGVIE